MAKLQDEIEEETKSSPAQSTRILLESPGDVGSPFVEIQKIENSLPTLLEQQLHQIHPKPRRKKAWGENEDTGANGQDSEAFPDLNVEALNIEAGGGVHFLCSEDAEFESSPVKAKSLQGLANGHSIPDVSEMQ